MNKRYLGEKGLGKGLVRGLAVFVLLVQFWPSIAVAETLRFASMFPPTALNNKAAEWWIKEVEAASGGDLEIKFFPGGSLGKSPKGQLTLLETGVADLVFVPAIYFPGQFPDNEVFELPFLIDDPLKASMVYWSMYEKGKLRGYEDFKPIALYTTPTYAIHLAHEVKSIDGFSNQKIRVGTKVGQEIVRQLGAVPVGGIAITQVSTALNRNTIDGAMMAFDAAAIFLKSPGLTKSHLVAPLGYSMLMVGMNKDSYEKLSPKSKSAIDSFSGEPYIRHVLDLTMTRADSFRGEVGGWPDHTVIEPQGAELERLRTLMAEVKSNWEKSHPRGSELLATVTETLKELEVAE